MSTDSNRTNTWRSLWPIISSHFWFISFGITGFIFLFFFAYIYLLRHPAYAVTTIPATMLDRLIGIEPFMLPFYLSLWLYLSLPFMLMDKRKVIFEYGLWIGSMCACGLLIFYFWPTRVPVHNIDWSFYPGMSFLKGMDGAGNACPSLHVATAVFSGLTLDRQLAAFGFGNRMRIFSAVWCACIVYSTMATKQHMAIDVVAGIMLAGLFVIAYRNAPRLTAKLRVTFTDRAS